MAASNAELRQALNRVLDKLRREEVAEVLDFALFLEQRLARESRESAGLQVNPRPASELRPIVGIVSLGGDALLDSERLFTDD